MSQSGLGEPKRARLSEREKKSMRVSNCGMNQTTRTKIAIPRLLLLLALVLAPLSVVQADIIRLKDGRELEGEIVGKTATTLRVKVNEFAVVEVKATQVKSIESKPTPWQLFADKLAALDKADVEGRFKLAMWAKEHNLNKRYRELLKAVITLNPDHAKARLELGYVNDNGKWLTEAQYYKKKGFERYRGRWLPKLYP